MTDQEFEKFYIDFKENPSCFVLSVYEQLTDNQLSKLLNGFEISPEQKNYKEEVLYTEQRNSLTVKLQKN